MAASTFLYVHQVQPGIYIRRKLTFQEIQDNAAGWRRLDVPLAYRRGRIHHDYVGPVAATFQGHQLGLKLGPLVVPNHFPQGYWRSFVRQVTIPGEAHGGHTTGVHNPPYALKLRCLNHRPGPFHVGAIHLPRVWRPQPVIGSHVEHELASRHSFAQRLRVAQVADYPLAADAFDVSRRTSRADKQAQVGALIGKSAGYMASNKTGCTCDKRLHGTSVKGAATQVLLDAAKCFRRPSSFPSTGAPTPPTLYQPPCRDQ